jgi:cell shape-determining protein MreD
MGDTQRRRLEEIIARELGLALLLLGVAIVQVAFPAHPLTFFPNVLLLLVICRALLEGAGSAARWAFYGGLALDLCAGTALGGHAIALLVGALAALIALAPFSRTSWLVPIAGVLLGALAYHLALALLMSVTVAFVDLRAYAVIAAIPETLATLIPALPAFLALRWLAERSRGVVPVDIL